jgi:hypothetical protein
MNRLFSPDDDSVGRIHDQLKHLANIGIPEVFRSGQLLTREQISLLLESVFWASLRADEGRTTRACVTVASHANFHDVLAFATPVVYEESQIAKLAPAVPRSGCLVVSVSTDGLHIWGFGRSRPGSSLDTVTIEVSEPGIVRVDVGPFHPFAVLNGRSNPIIAGTRTNLAHYLQRVLQKAFPMNDFVESQAVWRECLVLAILAKMIVDYGHGGMLLIVHAETGSWMESLSPFAYKFVAPDTTIRDGIRRELSDMTAQGEMLQRLWQADMPADLKNQVTGAVAQRLWYNERDVQAIASLAGVDGAIVMTRDLSVLGFGATIAVGGDTAPRVCMFRPEPGRQDVVLSPLEKLGGTRHQAAARFVGPHRDSVALVLSQDRHMSVVHWDETIDAVAVVRNTEWWI